MIRPGTARCCRPCGRGQNRNCASYDPSSNPQALSLGGRPAWVDAGDGAMRGTEPLTAGLSAPARPGHRPGAVVRSTRPLAHVEATGPGADPGWRDTWRGSGHRRDGEYRDRCPNGRRIVFVAEHGGSTAATASRASETSSSRPEPAGTFGRPMRTTGVSLWLDTAQLVGGVS